MVVDILLGVLNNQYVIGFMVLLMNFGMSHLAQDVMPVANRIFNHRWARRALLFVVFYTSTRNLVVSAVLTLATTLLLDALLNEDSRYCLIPFRCRSVTDSPMRIGRSGRARSTRRRVADAVREISNGISDGAMAEQFGVGADDGDDAQAVPLTRRQRFLLNAETLRRMK